jgi:hypothetical protein
MHKEIQLAKIAAEALELAKEVVVEKVIDHKESIEESKIET